MEINERIGRNVLGAALGAMLLVISAGASSAHDPSAPAEPAPAAPVCTSQEGISCSETCAPYPVNVSTVSPSSVQVTEVAESKQVSMIAGMPIDFTATCPPGMFALGGGYTLVDEGSTINMKEVRVMSTIADNTNPNGWNGWKVTVTRKPGAGAVDNCLKVEVRAYCVQGD